MNEKYETEYEKIEALEEEINILKKALKLSSENISRANKKVGNYHWDPESVYNFYYDHAIQRNKL